MAEVQGLNDFQSQMPSIASDGVVLIFCGLSMFEPRILGLPLLPYSLCFLLCAGSVSSMTAVFDSTRRKAAVAVFMLLLMESLLGMDFPRVFGLYVPQKV